MLKIKGRRTRQSFVELVEVLEVINPMQSAMLVVQSYSKNVIVQF